MSTVAPRVETVQAPVQEQEATFQTRKIMDIVGGHFIHDTYTAFVSPLLPLLIDKLSLTLTQAGSLSVFLQLPSLMNIFIGYFADKISLHYFVILAPAATATFVSVMGLASSYVALCLLLFIAGLSVAAFHVPSPAMIGKISGRHMGRGMSLYMAGGEMGRAVGPILVVWAVSVWGLDGIWRLAVIGWLTSAFLYWRLRQVSAETEAKKVGNIRAAMPRIKRLFIPLTAVMLLRGFVVTSLTVYLVVLLEGDGYSLETASQALALWSFAGIGGALLGGTISDRFGRRQTMAAGIGISSVLMVVMLAVDGLALIPVLILLGLTGLAVTPVIQAMVLEYMVDNRAMGNGIFMFISFVGQSIVTLLIGAMGDAFGLRPAFLICAGIALLSLPLIAMLPDTQIAQEA